MATYSEFSHKNKVTSIVMLCKRLPKGATGSQISGLSHLDIQPFYQTPPASGGAKSSTTSDGWDAYHETGSLPGENDDQLHGI